MSKSRHKDAVKSYVKGKSNWRSCFVRGGHSYRSLEYTEGSDFQCEKFVCLAVACSNLQASKLQSYQKKT